MTISFAFSQEMHLHSDSFDKNTDIIVPYKLGITSDTKDTQIPCIQGKHYDVCDDAATANTYRVFSFEKHSTDNVNDYNAYIRKLSRNNSYLSSWANAPTSESTRSELKNINTLLADYHQNNSIAINFCLGHKHKCYSLASELSNSHELVSYINKKIPDLNCWRAYIANDINLSSYTSCVKHASIILDEINTVQSAYQKEDPRSFSIHIALDMNEPKSLAMLETHNDSCHIKHITTYPYSQLYSTRAYQVQGSEQALLHSIIRMFQDEGIIKHVTLTNHSCKDENLRDKGWMPSNTEMPEDRRRKKRPSFCCFRK